MSSSHVPSFHNTVGQKISEGTLILNNKIIMEINLLNKTFVNEEIRALKSEIFLQNFNIFGRCQCLKAGHLTLNVLETDCEALQVFQIETDFQIVSGGQTITNYHVRASQSQRLDFTTDFPFTNIPVTYLSEIQDEDLSILHLIIDKLLLTSAGEPHLGKIAAISSGTVVIFLLCIVAACVYFPRFRVC